MKIAERHVFAWLFFGVMRRQFDFDTPEVGSGAARHVIIRMKIAERHVFAWLFFWGDAAAI
ncbi:hypothetical protein ACQKLP_22765 [Chitinophaga sp. NPDC101104]|uniref:hypothetical protein n=1 Tax=Chitinophaga sp. NPDC101104 TaxID=3390561 RepID=UPI003D04AC1D